MKRIRGEKGVYIKAPGNKYKNHLKQYGETGVFRARSAVREEAAPLRGDRNSRELRNGYI